MTPMPMRTRTPMPMRTRTPMPMRTRTSMPMRTRTSMPMRTPMRTRTPMPMRTPIPMPMPMRTPMPMPMRTSGQTTRVMARRYQRRRHGRARSGPGSRRDGFSEADGDTMMTAQRSPRRDETRRHRQRLRHRHRRGRRHRLDHLLPRLRSGRQQLSIGERVLCPVRVCRRQHRLLRCRRRRPPRKHHLGRNPQRQLRL